MHKRWCSNNFVSRTDWIKVGVQFFVFFYFKRHNVHGLHANLMLKGIIQSVNSIHFKVCYSYNCHSNTWPKLSRVLHQYCKNKRLNQLHNFLTTNLTLGNMTLCFMQIGKCGSLRHLFQIGNLASWHLQI
jgi:hypothetical protein